jgi:hypothetical protein
MARVNSSELAAVAVRSGVAGSIRIACDSFLFIFQSVTKLMKGTKGALSHCELNVWNSISAARK